MAEIQINVTGGDVTEQTSMQTRRGSTATDSPPVQDGVKRVSAHEREELTETELSREERPIIPSSECEDPLQYEDPLHYEDPVCIFQEQDTGFWRVGSAIIWWNSWWTRGLQ